MGPIHCHLKTKLANLSYKVVYNAENLNIYDLTLNFSSINIMFLFKILLVNLTYLKQIGIGKYSN